jgi:3-hydroxyisobutyrate dehydrogenase-like beta-hydroxyacid dehydrogenase
VTQNTPHDAAAWADLIILCGSYEEGQQFLRGQDVARALRGKCVLHLANGTPQEAEATAAILQKLGVQYLDACLLVRIDLLVA